MCSDSHRAQIEQMEADIRKLTRRTAGELSDEDSSRKKKPKKSYLDEELAKYSKNRGLHSKKGKDSARRKDESDVLAAMDLFRDRLRSTMQVDDEEEQRDGGGSDTEMKDDNGALKEGGGEEVEGGGLGGFGLPTADGEGAVGHACCYVRLVRLEYPRK